MTEHMGIICLPTDQQAYISQKLRRLNNLRNKSETHPEAAFLQIWLIGKICFWAAYFARGQANLSYPTH
jgi:hypothetical protein